MKHTIFTVFRLIGVLSVFAGGLAACSTPSPKTLPTVQRPSEAAPRLSLTTLEIRYTLGHDSFVFVTEPASQKTIIGKTLVNHKVLKVATLNPQGYDLLLQKAQAYIASQAPPTVMSAGCRSPFSLVIKNESGRQTAQGCRSNPNETAAFSRMIRDAEFLISSSHLSK